MSRIFTVEVECCLGCPVYRDQDRWCEFSNKAIPPNTDELKEVANFCKLETNEL